MRAGYERTDVWCFVVALAEDPARFDRIEILSRTEQALTQAAREIIRGLRK